MVAEPIINQPFSGNDFTTNVEVQEFTGTAEPGVIQVYVNGSAFGVDFDLDDQTWSYRSLPLNEGANTFTFKSFDGISYSPEITQVITYTPAEIIGGIINPPTGIAYRAYINQIDVMVEQPLTERPAQMPVAYNFYYSQNPNSNFVRLNLEPVRTPTEVRKTLLERVEEPLPDQTVENFEQLGGTFVKKATIVSEVYQEVGRFMYRHRKDSRIPLDPNVPAYYFVTAIYYDVDAREEIESVPSEEIVARAINIDASIKGLPQRKRSDIVSDYISYVYETDPAMDLAPGSIPRDIYIEPFAVELEKAMFLADFYSRTQSFITLVQIDDADGDGISDPVRSSPYKQRLKVALGLAEDREVQDVIDEAFVKLAANVGIPPQNATHAKGFVTIRVPELLTDIFVQAGAVFATTADTEVGVPAIYFTADISTRMLRINAPDYYNPNTGFFELVVPVTAQEPGLIGNVGQGQINRIISGVTGTASVLNTGSTTGGTNDESNVELAERGILAFVGADSGTRGGYLLQTLSVGGVQGAKIVGGGHPMMVRDLIPVYPSTYSSMRGYGNVKHVWGTVDVYVQGVGLRRHTDTFAIYDPVLDEERVDVESDILFQFNIINENVSNDSPLLEVIKVTNFTRGEDYDITGYEIISGTMFHLDASNQTNADIGLCDDDIVRVTYRYRQNPKLILSRQPVTEIVSIDGELSGDLTNNFTFHRNSHPLYEGRSNKAGDYITLESRNGKPVADLISAAETLTMIEEYPVPLFSTGILTNTIVVTNEDDTITYVNNADYNILLPTEDIPFIRIRRVSGGSIPNASTVNVSYQHGENITVEYLYEATPRRVAEHLEDFRHITADVIVKSALRSPVNIEAIVIKHPGYSNATVDSSIRKNINKFFSGLKMGNAIHESDIIAIIDDTRGVDFAIVPLTTMNRADHNFIMDERLPEVTWSVYRTDLVTSYITDDPVLQYKTIDKGGHIIDLFGGPSQEIRKVGIRDSYMMYDQQPSEFDVSRGPGRAYIRDDGKVIVSMHDDSNPTGKDLRVTYYTLGEMGSRSIFPAENEVLTLGTMNLNIMELNALNAGS